MLRLSPTRIQTLLAIAAVALATQAALAQSIANGGFEDSLDFNSWSIEPAFTGSLLRCASDPATAHSGSRSAHFGAHEGQPDILSKHIATIPGATYRISFWLASDNIAPIYDSFVVTWGNQVLLDLSNPQSGFAYTQYTYNVEAASYSEELAFHGFKRFGSFRLDDVNAVIAPASDSCGGAPRIVPNHTYTGDTFSATNDTNPPFCGLAFAPDVWYRLVAPCSTTLTMDLCGSSFNTTLSLYSGACGSLSLISCNDDSGGQGPCPGGQTSFVAANVNAGSTYYIRIAGNSAFARGNFVLNVQMPLPQNDDCINAIPVTLGGAYEGDNRCATTDGQYSCGNFNSHDLWYSYIPNCDHMLRVDTCSTTWDTVIAAYIGDCGALTEVACNDDTSGCGVNNRGSRLEFPVIAGTRYLLAVAQFGSGGASGTFVLNVNSVEERHDTCETAQRIVDGPHDFDARCASSPSGSYCNDAPLNRPGHWFEYTATCTSRVFVEICDAEGTSGAWLSAFSGDCASFTCVGAQQLTGMAQCPDATAAFGFDALEGNTYYICYAQPEGSLYRSGTITMKPARPENDFCLSATQIGEGSFSNDTSCASADGSATCGSSNGTPDVWYRWTAACDGQLTLHTCGSSFDTVLSVHRGTCGALEELSCNDDDPNSCPTSNRASRIVMEVTAGDTYAIRVSGFNGSIGAFQLSVQFSGANSDACATATPINSGTSAINGACAVGTEGRFCNSPTNQSGVWFSYTPACPGPKSLQFCRTGGPPSGLFSVFTGDCGSLTCIASRNANAIAQFCPSGINVLSFDAQQGVTYLICYTQFAGTPLGTGDLTILDTPPANDNCGAAAALVLGTNAGSIGCATPDGTAQCYPDVADVWYSFTPTISGRLILDTCGSSVDTVLSVFANSCSNLSLFACSDDIGEGGCNPSASAADLEVAAGTQYKIRVGLQSGVSGPFVLNAALVAANDNCYQAEWVNSGSVVTGNLSIAGNDGSASCSSSTGDRDVWYRWSASNCSSRLTLDTCGSAVDTVLSVYSGNCGALTEIACNDDQGSQGPCPAQASSSHISTAISPGQQYWIRLAGKNGAAGPFSLSVNESPRNTSCPDALAVTTGATIFNGQCGQIDTSGTPVSCGRPNQATLWFSYRARCTGTVAVDLCGSNYDTSVSAYGGPCGSLTELACNDNAGAIQCAENPFNSYIEFAVQENEVYTIRVSSIDDELSDGRLTIHCLIPCPADLNRDGLVDLVDLAQLLGHFGTFNVSHSDGDINQDGLVDLTDLAIMLSNFGTHCR